MRNPRGSAHIVALVLIAVIAVAAVGVALYYVNNDRAQEDSNQAVAGAVNGTNSNTVAGPGTRLVDATDGLFSGKANAIAANASEWIIAGASGRVAQYSNGSVGTYPATLDTFSKAVTSVGINADYSLIGGQAQLYRYDGITTQNLSANISSMFGEGFVQSMHWNGEYWVIAGGGAVVRYDGETFTNLATLLGGNENAPLFNGVTMRAIWNEGTQSWVIATNDGRLFTYDGQAVQSIAENPFRESLGGSIISVASNGETWLIGGRRGGKPALFSFDGTTFNDHSSLLKTDAIIGTVGWDGRNWVVASNTTGVIEIDPRFNDVVTIRMVDSTFSFSADQFAVSYGSWLLPGSYSTSAGARPAVLQRVVQ